jgi:hypothetical protein
MISLSQEAETLAKKLADMQSVSVEDAIRQAIEQRARSTGILSQARRPRDMSPEAIALRRQRGEAIIDRIAAMPVNDSRPLNEIIDDLNAV